MSSVRLHRAAPGHLVLTVDEVPHDFRFPAEGNLEAIVLSILGGQEYPTLRLPGWAPHTIVDVGANVGASALFFALAYPEARIRCFEPSADTARWLEDNTSWLEQVSVRRVGLHQEEQQVRLYKGTTQCAQASIARSIETTEVFEDISLVPAHEAIGIVADPAILKLDTEGCEVPVLRDLGEDVDLFDVIYVEYHSERDRRAIDALLGERFSLWKSKAHAVHRGTAAYVNARILQGWPAMGALEINLEAPLQLVEA